LSRAKKTKKIGSGRYILFNRYTGKGRGEYITHRVFFLQNLT